MLHGFEKQTAPLTAEEKILVPILIDILQYHQGIEKAIISKDICTLLLPHTKTFGKPITIGGGRLRKMINYIRIHGLLIGLVASNRGYYITHKPQELNMYIRSLMGREAAIRNLRLHIKNYLRTPVTIQQLRLHL